MSDLPAEDSASAKQIIEEARRVLEEIKEIKSQVEEQLKATEVTRKKADEDASYAYQAKVNTEEHSKAAAQFKGAAEADINSIATNKKNFDELVATATLSKATIEADTKAISENRKVIDQSATNLLELSEAAIARQQKLDDLKKSADLISNQITELRISADDASKKAQQAQTKAEQFATSANAQLEKISGYHGLSTKQAEEITVLLQNAKNDKDSLAIIVEHLSLSDKNATDYEKRLSSMVNKLAELTKTAETLLPGFTGVGLAHSFNAQKGRFAEPQKRWLRTFIYCIIGLIIVAAPSFINAVFGSLYGIQPNSDWEEILRGMAMRLPIVVPMVWLAIYAGRNYMLSLRLEEDYAYKEAISKAFEGYRRQMDAITAGDASNPAPLNKLCLNVLTAIAERPGRIYDGKQIDISILNEFKTAIEKTNELRNRNVEAV